MRDTYRSWIEAFEAFILRVIRKERQDTAAACARFVLCGLSKVFLLVVKLRRLLHA